MNEWISKWLFWTLVIFLNFIKSFISPHNRKWSGSTSSSNTSTPSVSSVQAMLTTPAVATPAPESPTVDMSNQAAEVTDGEWTYDPNEPRYCLCNQVSYGDMVACDNVDVRFKCLLALWCYIMQIFSVHRNGFIIHVLVLQRHRKVSGTVHSVLPRCAGAVEGRIEGCSIEMFVVLHVYTSKWFI